MQQPDYQNKAAIQPSRRNARRDPTMCRDLEEWVLKWWPAAAGERKEKNEQEEKDGEK